nr:MAG TPA: hypothetical protein [Caudoviricetes sp.]
MYDEHGPAMALVCLHMGSTCCDLLFFTCFSKLSISVYQPSYYYCITQGSPC